MSSPVLRQTVLCQSSFFFSLLTETTSDNVVWETVLNQTAEAFETLRKALQYVNKSDVAKHMHGAVRILGSILQVQRFEIAVLNFDNCRSHLTAALALFEQLMRSSGPDIVDPKVQFQSVVERLAPRPRLMPGPFVQVQSAEQAAFRFAIALLLLDDIIASTVLQEPPRLYGYHRPLLSTPTTGETPLIDVGYVIGCQNMMLLHIGEISSLDAWKQQQKRADSLDMMELVQRATSLRGTLETYLQKLSFDPTSYPGQKRNLLDQTRAHAWSAQCICVTRIWGHAAILYLSLVVSGWQPANNDVRYHVETLLDLLDQQSHRPALLRSVAWPFCVAGCLAVPSEEARFRAHIDALERPSIFGTLRKALKILENVWNSRNAGDGTSRDLAAFLRNEDELVLLI